MAYSEKVLGNAYVCEKLEQGFYRVVLENGECSLIRLPYEDNIGDKGILIYYSDGATFGLTKFKKDNSVSIDFKSMKDNYLNRWKTELNLPRY